MMLTLTYFTTNPSEECPGADHALFYHKTCHNLHSLRTLGFEGISPLCPPLPSRAVKLSFSTSPKTLSLKFVLAPVNREAELLASVFFKSIWSIQIATSWDLGPVLQCLNLYLAYLALRKKIQRNWMGLKITGCMHSCDKFW